MPTNEKTIVRTWYEFALIQMAAESYLEQVAEGRDLTDVLKAGANNLKFDFPKDARENYPGSTRMTPSQAKWFKNNYEVIAPLGNTASGFSAALIKDKTSGEYTLSFRSTEYQETSKGGDYDRDAQGADTRLDSIGFAFAQLVDMEEYYKKIKDTVGANTLNVTGYSLGGHLATAFTLLHADVVNKTYLFNSPGVGQIEQNSNHEPAKLTATTLQEMIDRYKDVLNHPENYPYPSSAPENPEYQNWLALTQITEPLPEFAVPSTKNIYMDPRERYANLIIKDLYKTSFASNPGVEFGPENQVANDKIHSISGRATSGDTEFVADSGMHTGKSQRYQVFIEGQPKVEGAIGRVPVPFIGTITSVLGSMFGGDFGNTHAIILMVDSLALMDVLSELEPQLGTVEGTKVLYSIFSAASNERAKTWARNGTDHAVESDSLEKVLDSLRHLFLGVTDVTETLSQNGSFRDYKNRTKFYEEIDKIKNSEGYKAAVAAGGIQIIDLSTLSAAEMMEKAGPPTAEGMAFRYALREGNAFAVIDPSLAIYARANTNGALKSWWDSSTGIGPAPISSGYYQSRADYLERKLLFNKRDLPYEIRKADPEIGPTDTKFDKNTKIVRDLNEDIVWDAKKAGSITLTPVDQIIFADRSKANTIDGGLGNDAIYGTDFSDTLSSGGGNDYLSGGAGDDTLINSDSAAMTRSQEWANSNFWNDVPGMMTWSLESGGVLDGGDGFDAYYADAKSTIIYDSDGLGTIHFNGETIGQIVYKSRTPGEAPEYWSASGDILFKLGATIATGYSLSHNNTIQFAYRKPGGGANGAYAFGIQISKAPGPGSGVPAFTPKPGSIPSYIPSRSWRPVDPIVLDLNQNNVIDTISAEQSNSFFDFNRDGLAERSGWLQSSDGFLAFDKNSNKVVDDLSELFGSENVDGFDDLSKKIDDNYDGTIDSKDSKFSQLLVWQDLNGDGISQSAELHSLSELSITQISLAKNTVNLDSNGNMITAEGTFTRNGQQQKIADVSFAVNFAITDSNPTRPLDVTPALGIEIDRLPELRGYGQVATLRQAMSIDNNLLNLVQSFYMLKPMEILGAFSKVIAQWSGLNAKHAALGVSHPTLTTEDKVWILEHFNGQDVEATRIENNHFGPTRPLSPFNPNIGGGGWVRTYIDSTFEKFVSQSAVKFIVQSKGMSFLEGVHYSLDEDILEIFEATAAESSLINLLMSAVDQSSAEFAISVFESARVDDIQLDLQRIKNAVASSPFSDLYAPAFEQSRDAMHLMSLSGSNQFVHGSDSSIYVIGTDGSDQIETGPGNDLVDGGSGNDKIYTAAGDDVVYSRDGNDVVFVGGGNNVVYAGAGNDDIHAEGGDDLIYGGDGGDDVFAGAGNDILFGGAGVDLLLGDAGNDTLDGGSGNDTLFGGVGTDTYLFGRDYGVDTISDSDNINSNSSLIVFGENISPSEIQITRFFDDLQLKIAGTNDRLNLYNFFAQESFQSSVNNFIKFGNGVVWSVADIRRLAVQGTDNNDDLVGYSSGDTIQGGNGDDRISGREGSDVLDGENGNDVLLGELGSDQLFGGEGNDRLDGGDGNDMLNGGAGTDTLFGGSGDDTLDGGEGDDIVDGGLGKDIYKYSLNSGSDTFASRPDSIVLFGTQIKRTDLSFKNNGYSDLEIRFSSTTDVWTSPNSVDI